MREYNWFIEMEWEVFCVVFLEEVVVDKVLFVGFEFVFSF